LISTVGFQQVNFSFRKKGNSKNKRFKKKIRDSKEIRPKKVKKKFDSPIEYFQRSNFNHSIAGTNQPSLHNFLFLPKDQFSKKK